MFVLASQNGAYNKCLYWITSLFFGDVYIGLVYRKSALIWEFYGKSKSPHFDSIWRIIWYRKGFVVKTHRYNACVRIHNTIIFLWYFDDILYWIYFKSLVTCLHRSVRIKAKQILFWIVISYQFKLFDNNLEETWN